MSLVLIQHYSRLYLTFKLPNLVAQLKDLVDDMNIIKF